MKKEFVLIDIDHVISDAAWRDEMIGGDGGWDAYHAESINDDPCHDIVQLVNALHSSGLQVIGLTARPEKWRMLTNSWLIKHSIQLDEILMRPDKNFSPSPELKISLARDLFQGKVADNVAFILDDRDDVVAAFRAEGITALQVFTGKSKEA
jgi:hypothetical protein